MTEITPAQIKDVCALVAHYISTQRDKYAARAGPLPERHKLSLSPFFSPELLDSVRIVVLGNERVATPDFYPLLRSLGFTDLPDQSTMAAITFDEVVVSHAPFTSGLLFHEFVHVEQYRQLGIARFSELYVHGFISGGGYDSIPLEVSANTLGGQFESNPKQTFSVADEVRRWIVEGRF